VAERSIFTAREAAFLKALVDDDVAFMIVGLSAALLQGAPAVTQDIDLWVRDLESPRFRRALKKVGGTYVPQIGLNPPMLAGDAVRLFDLVLHMSGLGSFDEERAHAIPIDIGVVQVPVLSLPRVIASKEAANRDKDRLVLPMLRDAALTVQAVRRRKPSGTRRRSRTRPKK